MQRSCARLALAALALQIVLSFGHVHLDGVHGAYAGAITEGASVRAPQPLPAQQPGDDGDYCAVCAIIYLAANLFVPQAPQLPVPFVSQAVKRFDRVAAVFIAPRRALFQSRAPPQA